jgi:hypothetical protein
MALLSAALVMALSIFAASPQLHAWLHSHDAVATAHHGTVAEHDQQLPDQDEDGCAIVLFANGVIAAVTVLVAIAAVWRLINSVVISGAGVVRQSPRYWLPPLCGPPLS